MIMSTLPMTCLHSTQRGFASHLFGCRSQLQSVGVDTFLCSSLEILSVIACTPSMQCLGHASPHSFSTTSTSGHFFFFINNLHSNSCFTDMPLGTPGLVAAEILSSWLPHHFYSVIIFRHLRQQQRTDIIMEITLSKPASTGNEPSHIAAK